MSQQLLSLNKDLKRLVDEGYSVLIVGGFLVIDDVPYLNSNKEIKTGTIISTLELNGDRTNPPSAHVVNFKGEYPHKFSGEAIEGIRHGSHRTDHGGGLFSDHSFSNKPTNGYKDYYEKMTTYIGILEDEANAECMAKQNIAVSAKVFKPRITDDPKSSLQYIDTHSSRCDIGALGDKFKKDRIGIIGLGGTGAYILDHVAKVDVSEIRLFDNDTLSQHNIFRIPGIVNQSDLDPPQIKSNFFRDRYSKVNKNIISYDVKVDSSNLDLLKGLNFVFIAIDDPAAKVDIFDFLFSQGIDFIDVGIGLEKSEEGLSGQARVTSSFGGSREFFNEQISLTANLKRQDAYVTEIQTAEFNSLNATLAVIKWKKYKGYYRDVGHEQDLQYVSAWSGLNPKKEEDSNEN